MLQHVILQVTSLSAGVVAMCANKRLLSTVNQHVVFQISGTAAWKVTLVATLGLLSIMLQTIVYFEVFHYLKGEIALNAKIKSVCLHFHGMYSTHTQSMLLYQSANNDNWRKVETNSKVKRFLKSESCRISTNLYFRKWAQPFVLQIGTWTLASGPFVGHTARVVRHWWYLGWAPGRRSHEILYEQNCIISRALTL